MQRVFLAFIFLLACECLAFSDIEWFQNHPQFAPFKSAWRGLDRNDDGVISVEEIRFGLRTDATKATREENFFVPQSFSCVPRLDTVHFIDCWVIAARQSNRTTTSSAVITFNEAVSQYFGGCTDMSPRSKMRCSDIVERSPEICRPFFEGNSTRDHCRMSCFQCQESNILGRVVRGKSGEFMSPQGLSALSYALSEDMSLFLGKPGNTDVSNPGDTCTPVNSNKGGPIFWISDWHTEPWYSVDKIKGKISRFSGSSLSNMWECRDSNGNTVDCMLTGQTDPPFEQFDGVLQYVQKHKTVRTPILFFVGDTQAHKLKDATSTKLHYTVTAMMNKTLPPLLNISPASHIIYTAGNNDGTHDAIFTTGGDKLADQAWAESLLNARIVTNDLYRTYSYNGIKYNQTQFFSHTGYYMKLIPTRDNTYAVILNTNLGASDANQMRAFTSDLSWIESRGGQAVVFGHHPDITSTIVPDQFKSIVVGTFSGHVHYFQPTDSKGFTICPALSQASPYAGFLTGDFNSSGHLVLTTDNLIKYQGAVHKVPEPNCWA